MDRHPEDPASAPEQDPENRTVADEDEDLARLRAADPAAAAGAPGLDSEALRAVVARRIAADTGPEVAADAAREPRGTNQPGAATEEVVPLAPPRHRPARWLQVAAVAAGLAVVGGGSYALGRSGDRTPAPGAAIVLDGSGSGTRAAAADSAAQLSAWSGGRTVFTASGLSDEAGTARAWALDAASVFSAATAARIAAALGVTGEPTQQWGTWTVGPTDGTGPTVSLQPDGTAGVSYYDPTRDPWTCAASAADQPGTATTDDGTAGTSTTGASTTDDATTGGDVTGSVAVPLDPTIAVPSAGVVDPELLEQEQVEPLLSATVAPCDPAAAPAPTGEAALAEVRDVLSTLGVEPGGFELVVEDTGADTRSTQVTANQVLDGQRTGLTWSVTLVDGGVQSLYGFLAPLVDLGEYPVVGAATAVDRLDDPRFGPASSGVVPLARAETADGASDSTVASADPTVPVTVAPGAAIPWPVQQVTITGARLGVTQVVQADGAALLVPAYELTGDDPSTWSVIAVAEESLDLAG